MIGGFAGATADASIVERLEYRKLERISRVAPARSTSNWLGDHGAPIVSTAEA